MAYNCNILLGRIKKINGFKGAVTVKLEKTFTENIPEMETVFLEIEGRPVPFFISDYEYSGADLLNLTFTGYDTVDKVKEFTGCSVFLTSTDNRAPHPDDLEPLKKYTVITSDGILIGKITGVIRNPGQWLLIVNSDDKKEILIPFHENLIIRMDKRKYIMVMDIPDGLLDIN